MPHPWNWMSPLFFLARHLGWWLYRSLEVWSTTGWGIICSCRFQIVLWQIKELHRNYSWQVFFSTMYMCVWWLLELSSQLTCWPVLCSCVYNIMLCFSFVYLVSWKWLLPACWTTSHCSCSSRKQDTWMCIMACGSIQYKGTTLNLVMLTFGIFLHVLLHYYTCSVL